MAEKINRNFKDLNASLERALEYKSDIKEAIKSRGVEVSNKLSEFSDAIRSIDAVVDVETLPTPSESILNTLFRKDGYIYQCVKNNYISEDREIGDKLVFDTSMNVDEEIKKEIILKVRERGLDGSDEEMFNYFLNAFNQSNNGEIAPANTLNLSSTRTVTNSASVQPGTYSFILPLVSFSKASLEDHLNGILYYTFAREVDDELNIYEISNIILNGYNGKNMINYCIYGNYSDNITVEDLDNFGYRCVNGKQYVKGWAIYLKNGNPVDYIATSLSTDDNFPDSLKFDLEGGRISYFSYGNPYEEVFEKCAAFGLNNILKTKKLSKLISSGPESYKYIRWAIPEPSSERFDVEENINITLPATLSFNKLKFAEKVYNMDFYNLDANFSFFERVIPEKTEEIVEEGDSEVINVYGGILKLYELELITDGTQEEEIPSNLIFGIRFFPSYGSSSLEMATEYHGNLYMAMYPVVGYIDDGKFYGIGGGDSFDNGWNYYYNESEDDRILDTLFNNSDNNENTQSYSTLYGYTALEIERYMKTFNKSVVLSSEEIRDSLYPSIKLPEYVTSLNIVDDNIYTIKLHADDVVEEKLLCKNTFRELSSRVAPVEEGYEEYPTE